MAEAYDGEVLSAPPSAGPQPYEGEVLTAPPTMNVGDINPQLGVAQGAASILSGAIAAPAAGLSGMAAAFAKALGITDTEAADVVRKVQDALTYEPPSKIGQKTAAVIAAPFEALGNVANKAGEKVTDVTGSPALGATANTAVQAIPAVLGKVPKVVSKLKSMDTVAANNRARIAALEVPAREGAEGARAAGYVLTPSSEGVPSGATSRLIEGVAGGPRLEKLASRRGQYVSNDFIRKDVGLSDDVPITREALDGAAKDAGKAYDALREAGTLKVDKAYKGGEMGPETTSTWEGAPSMDPKTSYVVSAADAVESIKQLRADARGYYKAYARDANPETLKKAQANETAAEQVEGLVERNLKDQPELLDNFREARTRMAKIFQADRALNETTGNIDARVYAKMLKDKVPLTGGALQVALFARQFPKLVQPVERLGNTGMTLTDLWNAGFAKEALLVGARPIARHILLSKPGQAAIMGHPVRATARTAGQIQSMPATGAVEMSAEERRKRRDELLQQLE